MSTVLVLDAETTGTDPERGALIEVATARYDLLFGLIDVVSVLVGGVFENPAFHINGIAVDLSKAHGRDATAVHKHVAARAEGCMAVVAHNAAFDKQWLPSLASAPWVCSQRHIDWPNEAGRDVSLERLALAHGLGVVPGHRAATDVMTLVNVFDQVRFWNYLAGGVEAFELEHIMARALRPRALYAAKVDFRDNHLAKARRFEWCPMPKQWRKELPIEDVARLEEEWGFKMTEVRA